MQLLSGSVLDRLAGRIEQCSGYLEFGLGQGDENGEQVFRLTSARFCRVRQCPICQWRKALMWRARFYKAFPAIERDFPKARYIFLTLTVKNCPISDLRETIRWMNDSWKRLTNRQTWPALGFIRTTEVTRGKDGTAHPHFHCLLMVQPSYFQGKYYLSHAKWTELWQSCLQVDYTPIVEVHAVKPRADRGKARAGDQQQAIADTVMEVFKYAVKPEQMLGDGTEVDRAWLIDLASSLHKTRSVVLGGVFRQYMSESEPEDLIGEEGGELDSDLRLWFGWREMVSRYVKVDTPKP